MQDQSSLKGEFTQEDSYPIAREDGTGWTSSKDTILAICRNSVDFEHAFRVALEWDRDNEPPWGLKLKERVQELWNWGHSDNQEASDGFSVPRLSRPDRLDFSLAENIVAKYGPGAATRIKAASRPTPNTANALDFLFPNNPWIAVSQYALEAQHTTQRDIIRGIEDRFAWLSPNPFKAKQIQHKGKWSMRCDANVLARHHLVIEFDLKIKNGWGPTLARWSKAGLSALDVHGALFLWLAARSGFQPFMIVYSGNVSYHAWYDTRTISEDQLAALVELTLPIGGDPASLVPSQLFRMPGGTRLRKNMMNNQITRVRQTVVFWNPYKT